MSPSLFATMKIVAQMVAVDREIHPKERSWFLALMNTFGATGSQRRALISYLNDDHKHELPHLISQISEGPDRSRLLNLLTVAIHADKQANPSEKDFYAKVKFQLEKNCPVAVDYKALGNALKKRDRDMKVWGELGKLGNTLNARTGYYMYCYPYDTFDAVFFAYWLGEILFTGKAKYVSIAFIIACILMIILTLTT